MPDTAFEFYQQLAKDYHLIYADWTKAIERQGAALDRLIRTYCHTDPNCNEPLRSLLDCSCGIGTQSIGLAQRGYTVYASDISPAAVKRAEQEAVRFGVSLQTAVADMRTLASQVPGQFDVVLSCDNAVPHLLADDDLLLAAQNMRVKLKPGGLLLISIRDYDHLVLEKQHATLPQVFDDDGGRRIVFQVWDWSQDGRQYTINMFILRQTARGWKTSNYATTYRALQRAELSAALSQAGFVSIRWHMPQDTGYYQPVVTAQTS